MKIKHVLHTTCSWLFLAGLLIAFLLVLQARVISFENINAYTTADVTYKDGSTAHFDDKNFGIVNRDDVVTLHIRLPEQPFYRNSSLIFYDYNAVTEVWFRNILLDSYGEDIAAKGMMIGNHTFFIPVPDGAWGEEITVILRATENRAFSNFTNLKIYPAEKMYQFYTGGDPVGFIVVQALFVFALIGLFGLVLGKMRGVNLLNALSLSVMALLISTWMLINRGIYNIFGFHSYFWQPLEYIAGYAIPIPMLLFYRGSAKTRPKWKKWLDACLVLSSVFLAVSVILNFTNLVHFDALMGVGGVVLALSAFLLLLYVATLRTDRRKVNIVMKIGVYLFMGTGLYELFVREMFRYFSFPFLHSLPSVLPIGVLSLLVCMTIAFCSDLYEKQKDVLTVQVKAKALGEVIDATPVGICQLIPDESLTVVAANDIFYRIMGYDDAELLNGKPKIPYAHLLDNEKEYFSRKVKEVVNGTENRGELEFSTVNSDGKPITFLIRYFYDRGHSGNITISLMEITDRKRMEDELRIQSEEYRLAVEASEYLFFKFDAESKTCSYLFDAEKLFGITEKLLDAPESLIAIGLFAPESAEECRKAFRMFYDGIPKGDFVLHVQNIRTHQYRWYGGSYRTVFDASGAPLRAIVAFKDVTEEREREIAFNIHKKQIESSPEDEINYFEINLATGTCLYSYGTQAKQMSQFLFSDWDEIVTYATEHYVHPDDRISIGEFLNTEHLQEIYEHGVTEAAREYRGYMVDERVHWLHAAVRITEDPQSHETRVYCTIEDIDEEKAAELERQLEQQRSQYYVDAYDKLASSVMYGVCKCTADNDFAIIFANDIFYQMHGYASQVEAVAAGFTSILHAAPPLSKEIMRAGSREYIEGKAGQPFEIEYPTIDAGGHRIWILCRGVYSPEEDIFNASVLNITDRKNTEEQLRISEEQYRLALSQSGKVFFFFDVPARTLHISNEMAQSLGLPTAIGNMPDNYLETGLIDPQSVDKFRQFYGEIYAGKPAGSAVICCRMNSAQGQAMWYKMAFTTVFSIRGVPQSAIITCEDLQEEHANKIAGAWRQINLLSASKMKYSIAEYNLTRNQVFSRGGDLFPPLPEFLTGFDESNRFVLEHFIEEEDREKFGRFLDRDRLLAMYAAGQTEDTIEYRSTQSGNTPRWTSTSIQMIQDPYSDDVLVQLLIMDIHAEKSGQIEMAQSYEELKKELENSRIKVMINQMQPHFLYNALSAIQTIVKVDPDYAYRLIYDFTVHLRSSIKALSSDAPIPFTDELKNIQAYLNIEKMRFGDALRVRYEIDCDQFSVIPLSIQPLAENAARHGVYPKGDEGGTVTVRTYETVNSYMIEVEDDGVGFDSQEVLEKGGDSVGLKSLIFRLKSLMDADVTIYSHPGAGTKVTVAIPKERG